MHASARIVADSVNPETGDRVTSIEMVMHRFVLAELNTHRVFARNSASSRAIPLERNLEQYRDDPAWPVAYPREQPGMQGGEDLEGEDLLAAVRLLRRVHWNTVCDIESYVNLVPKENRLHKSVINRLLEPFLWHKVLVTGVDWDGFFVQRRSEAAQPEIQDVAELAWEAREDSKPRELAQLEWHRPYGGTVQESVARCARLSYGGGARSNDAALHDRLLEAGHWSPFEHVMTPWNNNVLWTQVPGAGPLPVRTARVGAFPGWLTYRHSLGHFQ